MANYYISNSGKDSNNGLSETTPWQTISKVNSSMSKFKSGDNIYFKCGDSFTGRLNITCVGNSSAQVNFATYGSGPKPIFQQAGGEAIQVGAYNPNLDGYVTIDGFNITDLTFNINDKAAKAPCEQGIRIGYYQDYKKTNIIIRNCEFSNIGGAVVINGDNCVVEHCRITNMKNVQNTYSTTFPGNDNDYGANPFTINGSDNLFIKNYIAGGWAESEDYGWNGGAFEMFDSCNRNKIIGNTIVDCGGIAEFGAFAANANSVDNLFAYNKIINCGNLSWINFSGTFTCNATNVQYFNNVIIENSASRFTGPNFKAGVVTQRVLDKLTLMGPEPSLLNFSRNSPNTVVYNLRNNIFVLSTSGVILSSTVASKTTHLNNIYRLTNGRTLNAQLDPSERAVTGQIFKDESNPNPEFWDFHLLDNSIGINFGTNVNLTADFDGNPIVGLPDVGIFEGQSTSPTPPLVISVTSTPILNYGGDSTVVVSATGGTAPYSGTGTFTKKAGTHTFTVTDAKGLSATKVIIITQPSDIVITSLYQPINVIGGTTSITVSATGGISPYTYAIDGGTFTATNVFGGVKEGTHLLSVKDSTGYKVDKSITVPVVIPVTPVVVNATATPITVNGGTSTVTVSATGGTPPYTGVGTFVKPAGTHTFTVTDSLGATGSKSITITQPAPTSNFKISGVTVRVKSGVAPITYSVDGGSYQTSNTFNTLSSGTHVITAKDAKGFISTMTVIVP